MSWKIMAKAGFTALAALVAAAGVAVLSSPSVAASAAETRSYVFVYSDNGAEVFREGGDRAVFSFSDFGPAEQEALLAAIAADGGDENSPIDIGAPTVTLEVNARDAEFSQVTDAFEFSATVAHPLLNAFGAGAVVEDGFVWSYSRENDANVFSVGGADRSTLRFGSGINGGSYLMRVSAAFRLDLRNRVYTSRAEATADFRVLQAGSFEYPEVTAVYGEPLPAVAAATPVGNWTWAQDVDPAARLEAGTHAIAADFTPFDENNYASETGVKLNVRVIRRPIRVAVYDCEGVLGKALSPIRGELVPWTEGIDPLAVWDELSDLGLTYTSAALTADTPGIYTIEASATNHNYDVIFINGASLEVNPDANVATPSFYALLPGELRFEGGGGLPAVTVSAENGFPLGTAVGVTAIGADSSAIPDGRGNEREAGGFRISITDAEGNPAEIGECTVRVEPPAGSGWRSVAYKTSRGWERALFFNNKAEFSTDTPGEFGVYALAAKGFDYTPLNIAMGAVIALLALATAGACIRLAGYKRK